MTLATPVRPAPVEPTTPIVDRAEWLASWDTGEPPEGRWVAISARDLVPILVRAMNLPVELARALVAAIPETTSPAHVLFPDRDEPESDPLRDSIPGSYPEAVLPAAADVEPGIEPPRGSSGQPPSG